MTAVELTEIVAAQEPPELRGSGRDDVSLLVADRRDGSVEHYAFRDLPSVLREGDLLVVNTSATLAAALATELDGVPVELHLSTCVSPGTWVVELRSVEARPLRPPPVGTRLELPLGASAEIVAPYAGSARLTVCRLELDTPVEEYLRRYGRPIRYGYARADLPIDAYQTVFALHPGSAEMPSAGRPFTTSMVTELVSRGVLIAPITLHAGVSSPELGEPPYPERFRVPEGTARLVNAVHWWGGRVIAVGTTAIRALESAAGEDGRLDPADGWASLTITPETGLRVTDGLLTGWHEPRSSHLQILEAIAGQELLDRSYREARLRGYRWHEFGDVHLILS